MATESICACARYEEYTLTDTPGWVRRTQESEERWEVVRYRVPRATPHVSRESVGCARLPCPVRLCLLLRLRLLANAGRIKLNKGKHKPPLRKKTRTILQIKLGSSSTFDVARAFRTLVLVDESHVSVNGEDPPLPMARHYRCRHAHGQVRLSSSAASFSLSSFSSQLRRPFLSFISASTDARGRRG